MTNIDSSYYVCVLPQTFPLHIILGEGEGERGRPGDEANACLHVCAMSAPLTCWLRSRLALGINSISLMHIDLFSFLSERRTLSMMRATTCIQLAIHERPSLGGEPHRRLAHQHILFLRCWLRHYGRSGCGAVWDRASAGVCAPHPRSEECDSECVRGCAAPGREYCDSCKNQRMLTDLTFCPGEEARGNSSLEEDADSIVLDGRILLELQAKIPPSLPADDSPACGDHCSFICPVEETLQTYT